MESDELSRVDVVCESVLCVRVASACECISERVSGRVSVNTWASDIGGECERNVCVEAFAGALFVVRFA